MFWVTDSFELHCNSIGLNSETTDKETEECM